MSQAPLPAETRVLNTADGETGTIMNGFTYDPATGEWTEYEVATDYGVERWKREDFIVLSDLPDAD